MLNNQFDISNNDNVDDNGTHSFAYPACFIEFEQQEVRTASLGIKYVDIIIRLHLGIEEYSKERPQDYNLIDEVDYQMIGMRGSEIDTVQFGSLRENNTILDTDFNNVNNPILEYITTYTRKNSYTRKDFVVKSPPNQLNVIGEKL